MLPGEGLAADQVDNSGEIRFLANGKLQRSNLPAILLLQQSDDARVRGPVAIHQVDCKEDRQTETTSRFPHLLGLHLDARDRRDHHQGGIGHPQTLQGVGGKDAIPGGVDQVDLDPAVLEVGNRGVDRDLAVVLVLVKVGRGVGVVYLAQAVDCAAVEQHRRNQRGFAGVGVAHHRNVTDLVGRIHGHGNLLYSSGIARK